MNNKKNITNSENQIIVTENQILENKKIDILISENQNRRNEIIATNNQIYKSLFAFIATMGGLVGTLLSKDSILVNGNADIIVFLLSQIEFVIVIFCLGLISAITNQALYVAYLEEKINEIVKDNLVFWESKMVIRMWRKGPMIISQSFLYVIYFAFFVVLGFICYKIASVYWHRTLFLTCQAIEFGIVIMIVIKSLLESNKIKKYINQIKIEKWRKK